MKKYKILTISDIPLVPSGVGTQFRYLAEGLLRTGKYTLRSIGGAIKHPSYNPIKIDPWGDDWIVYPVDGYGDKMRIRSMIDQEKPDAFFMITDPRFFIWLWEMSDEILPQIPIIYWHVWDNLPTPDYNKGFYKSTTYISCISKLTHHIMKDLGFENRSCYLPHGVPEDLFKPLAEAEVQKHKEMILGPGKKDKKIVFWNNRNARRKNPSDLIWAITELNKRMNNEVVLVMHCNPSDPEGPALGPVVEKLGAQEQVVFSANRLDTPRMNILYNMADITCNISFAEGFGLSQLESHMAGTCTLSQKTGGLQDQHNPDDNFSICLEPDSQTMVGSQQIPYILEDRISIPKLVDALEKFFKETDRAERRIRGLRARKWALENFNLDKNNEKWDQVFTDVIENYKTKYHHFDPWRFHTI